VTAAEVGRRRAGRVFGPLAVALLAVGVALALPSPNPAAPQPEPAPSRLADVWPSSHPVTLPSGLADGSSYVPLLVLDQDSSLGVATSADLGMARLVLRDADAVRELRVFRGQQRPTVAGATVADGRLYWVETGDGQNGTRETSVWSAPLAGGSPRQLAKDSSDVLYFDSAYDVQVAGGRVYWAVAVPGEKPGGEIRSVPVNGGPVSVRPLERLYALTTWPWATSSGDSQPGDVQLLNLATGEQRTVSANPDEILTCTPVWCRVTTLINQGQSLLFEVERVDGQGRRRIGDTALTPLNTDVALLDRFEVLASVASASGSAQKLWLHDLSNDRVVLLADTASTTIGSRGSYLWWSTGDNETRSWHILNLSELR
jgi:hypothetical protein